MSAKTASMASTDSAERAVWAWAPSVRAITARNRRAAGRARALSSSVPLEGAWTGAVGTPGAARPSSTLSTGKS
jgi:hypothetical protein